MVGTCGRFSETSGIVFKGSGFYRNDSRSGHPPHAPAATGSGSASEAAASVPSGGEVAKPAESGATAEKKTEPAPSAVPAAAQVCEHLEHRGGLLSVGRRS